MPVATISTPVSKAFLIITSPIFTGALTVTELITAMLSSIFSLGIGFSVFTGTRGFLPPVTFTVEVKDLVGAVHSVTAYASPRLH